MLELFNGLPTVKEERSNLKLSMMDPANDNETLLHELNENKRNDLIPFFVILGFLSILGLLGNVLLISFVWPEAKRNVGQFFLFILAAVDTLICLTVTLVLFEYSKIYIFRSDAVCKISPCLRLSFSLFSTFVLVAIVVYRYLKVCRPLGKQIEIHTAKRATVIGAVCAIILSVPVPFLVEIRETEVKLEGNVTVMGSECIVTVFSDNSLKGFHIFVGVTITILFSCSFAALIVLYVFLGKAILEAKRNHDKLTKTIHLPSITRHIEDNMENEPVEEHAEHEVMGQNNENGKNISISKSPGLASTKMPPRKSNARKTSSSNELETVGRQRSEDYISSTKLTVMFSIITLGFIVSFLPYFIYSTWRDFFAERTDVAFSVSPLRLFGLNSYLINSVINFIMYGFFNKRFRLYLKNCVSCRRTP